MKRRDALIAIGVTGCAMIGKFVPTLVRGEEKKEVKKEEEEFESYIDAESFVMGPYNVALSEEQLNQLELHYADGSVTRIPFKEIFSALKEVK